MKGKVEAIFDNVMKHLSLYGPNFKFEDVAVFDLNFIGPEIPESIGVGQHLHITA